MSLLKNPIISTTALLFLFVATTTTTTNAFVLLQQSTTVSSSATTTGRRINDGSIIVLNDSLQSYNDDDDINQVEEEIDDNMHHHLGELRKRSRRSFLCNTLAVFPLMASTTLTLAPEKADASGGATAGGAYLLSAKKRYYERVKDSIKNLLEAEDALKKDGDSKLAKTYFAVDNDTDGSWKDLTAAGYLLSNAFRRSASTNPDSLPAVKKYKAFAKEIDNYQKALKKKGPEAAVDSFESSVAIALDEWLEEIELPPAKEL